MWTKITKLWLQTCVAVPLLFAVLHIHTLTTWNWRLRKNVCIYWNVTVKNQSHNFTHLSVATLHHFQYTHLTQLLLAMKLEWRKHLLLAKSILNSKIFPGKFFILNFFIQTKHLLMQTIRLYFWTEKPVMLNTMLYPSLRDYATAKVGSLPTGIFTVIPVEF